MLYHFFQRYPKYFNIKTLVFLLGSTICQQTKILLGMVVVFVFCQFFPIVGDVYELMCLLAGNNSEGICVSNVHIENSINFGHFMLMVNSSVNFVFYMTNIAKFREGFLQVILPVYFIDCSYLMFMFWAYFCYSLNFYCKRYIYF